MLYICYVKVIDLCGELFYNVLVTQFCKSEFDKF